MGLYLTPRQFASIAAFLIATLAIIRSHGAEDDAGITAPFARAEADALASELARCRTVTTDQTAPLEICRRVWAENRRQFFRPTKKPPIPAGPVPTSATATAKNGDGVSPVEAEH